MKTFLHKGIVIGILLVGIVLNSIGQNSASIHGFVTDTNGTAIPNVAVYVSAPCTGFGQVVYTNSIGHYITGESGLLDSCIITASILGCSYSPTIFGDNETAWTIGTDSIQINLMHCGTTECTNSISVSSGFLDSIYFDFSIPVSGTAIAFSWDFGDFSSSFLQNPAHYYAPGDYMACALAFDINGCIAQSCDSVSFPNDTLCTSEFTVSTSNTNDSMAYDFNQTAYIGNACVWDFGNGTVGTGPGSTSNIYQQEGDFVVCLTADYGNCASTTCQTISAVILNPEVCNAEFYYYENPYLGNIYVDQSSNNSTTWNWAVNDSVVSAEQDPVINTNSNVAPVEMCLTITTPGGCTSSYCDSVGPGYIGNTQSSIGCTTVFYTLFDAADPFNITIGNIATSDSTIRSYYWNFGDDSYVYDQYPAHTYTDYGNYILCLTTYGDNGCSSTFCDTIGVDSNGNYTGKAAGFTINVVTEEDFNNAISSTDKNNLAEIFKIFPNPFNNTIHIEFERRTGNNASLNVINVTGKRVLFKSINNVNQVSLNLEELPKGIYFLEILNEDKNIIEKIVKLR